MFNPNDINDNLGLDEREIKMLKMSVEYAEDPFGAPNHLMMILIAKLWNLLVIQS